ncbi:MAG: hypothetical protein Q9165_001042 [Trypethelium subeluteriae]
MVWNKELGPPSDETIALYRAQVLQGLSQGNPRIPLPPPVIDPFMHMLKTDPQAQLEKLQDIQNLIESTCTNPAQPILTARSARAIERDRNRHEDTVVRNLAAFPFYLRMNITKMDADIAVHRSIAADRWSNEMDAHRQKLLEYDWTFQYKCLTQYLKSALAALVQMIGFETFDALNEAQRGQLFKDIFDRCPQLIAIQFHEGITVGVNVTGVWYGPLDEYRQKHREFQRYKFIKAMEATWRFRLNVDPNLEKKYRACAFETMERLSKDKFVKDLNLGTPWDMPAYNAGSSFNWTCL